MKADVVYAKTNEGVELAVIDVTNPAFAVHATDGELEVMAEQYIREARQQQAIPASLREALRSSMLGRGLMAASGTFLDGMSTYLLKLGPENLDAEASPVDRRIAASFPAFTAKVRLQDMAGLLTEGLARTLAVERRRRLCLVNIGGGVGADSWNALILLQKGLNARLRDGLEAGAYIGQEGLLAGREIVIAVLDLDARGPAFGVRAVAALGASGAPLNGMEITVRFLSYEWSDVERLRMVLEGLNAGDAACGISSEGGLFEYGSDEEIVANLKALHVGSAGDAIVVGSVTRDAEPVRVSLVANRIATRPRTLESFRELCDCGGWKVEKVVERPFSYHVRMVKI
jgi:hypothetical protein